MSSWLDEDLSQLRSILYANQPRGVLLSGSFGSGVSVLVKEALKEFEQHFPILRLECSQALATTKYAVLAPLLGKDPTLVDGPTAGIIRNCLENARKLIDSQERDQPLLILVEDGQFIDSGSAYVLGQLSRSEEVLLFVQTMGQQLDSLSLDALMSIARLERMEFREIDAVKCAKLVNEVLGMPTSRGTLHFIHENCAKLPGLIIEYTKMLHRQGKLTINGSRQVLREQTDEFDETAIATMNSLARRHGPKAYRLMQLLSLTGSILANDIPYVGSEEISNLELTPLISVVEGRVVLSSIFLSNALRLDIEPELRLELLTEYYDSNEVMVNDARALHSMSEANMDVSHVNASDLTKIALQNGEYQLVISVYESLPMVKKAEVRSHYFAALAVLEDWQALDSQKSEWPPGLVDVLGFFREEQKPVASQSINVDDILLISQIRRARSEYLAGDLILLEIDGLLSADLLIPKWQYSLQILALNVRILIAKGQAAEAIVALENLSTGRATPYIVQGTLDVLRALANFQMGHISSARENLQSALAELDVFDPTGLLPLGVALASHVEEQENSNTRLNEIDEDRTKAFTKICLAHMRQRKYSEAASFFVQLESLKARFLIESSDLDQNWQLPEIEKILLETGPHAISTIYSGWPRWADADLRKRILNRLAQVAIPEDFLLAKYQHRVVWAIEEEFSESKINLAQEIFSEGFVSLAVELMAVAINELSEVGTMRERGAAVRLVHSWFVELDEKPWGKIAEALTNTMLTVREQEIAKFISDGLSNKEIARELTVSQRTVEGHVYRIFAKLGVTSRAEIAFVT